MCNRYTHTHTHTCITYLFFLLTCDLWWFGVNWLLIGGVRLCHLYHSNWHWYPPSLEAKLKANWVWGGHSARESDLKQCSKFQCITSIILLFWLFCILDFLICCWCLPPKMVEESMVKHHDVTCMLSICWLSVSSILFLHFITYSRPWTV